MNLWVQMQTTALRTSNRNESVIRVIDRVLNQIFGKEATLLIYRHLERNYGIKRSEVSDKIELFARGLEDFLRSGAYVVERKILEDIDSRCFQLRRMELEDVDDGSVFVSRMKMFMRKA